MIASHIGDEICPSFFAHAGLLPTVCVIAEDSAKALSLAASSCFSFLIWSKLIVNNISSLWPGCPVLWWRVPWKNEVLPPTRWVLMDLQAIGVMPEDLEDFLGKSGYETWTGFELVFWFFRGSGLSTLQNRAVFHNLEYFGEGEGATKESGPASRHREGCP